MAVITVSRQMGSLGSEVAFTVADLLGYRLVWRELINKAARRAGAPETALAVIDELGLLGVSPSRQANQAYSRAVEQVMHELVQEGNVVILGRAGQVILEKTPDALHVRIIAPLDLRVERIAQKLSIAPEHARAQVEASDRNRASYMRRFYHVQWDDPSLYHLIINTGYVAPAHAAGLICQAVQILLKGSRSDTSKSYV
jgi:cytidylate kinase